jgi:DNA-binding transcriptional LysR family regulator
MQLRDMDGTPRQSISMSSNCINLRLPTLGGLYTWEFQKGKRELKVHVDGQLVFNGTGMMLNAVLAGLGLSYLPENLVQARVAEGRLIRVLADWCPPFPGYHLYYPSRRQAMPAFAVVVEALRYRISRVMRTPKQRANIKALGLMSDRVRQ